METKIYKSIAQLIVAIDNCKKSNNDEWYTKHTEKLESVMQSAPSGSGFDNGTELDYAKSSENKLVFNTAFHHMNEDGYYTEWTQHQVIITPALARDYDIKVTGKNKNDIKDYIADTFVSWLSYT